MTIRRGLHVADDDGEGADALEARLALAGLFSAFGILDGLAVTGRSSWAYNVAAGKLGSSRGANDGAVLFANDSSAIVGTSGEGSTIPPAPATGSRIDIIYALHRDVDNGDADSLPTFGVASGTASGSPVAPTIPTGAIELARATVAAGATNTAHANVTIAPASPTAVLRGAIASVANTVARNAVRDALSAAGHNFAARPLITYRTDAKVLEVNNGSTLSFLAHADATAYAMAAGLQAIDVTTDSAVLVVNNPWPSGRFNVAPIVTGTISGGTAGTAGARLRIDSVTTTSFRILVTGLIAPTPPATLTFSVAWQAVQMTSTTAEG